MQGTDRPRGGPILRRGWAVRPESGGAGTTIKPVIPTWAKPGVSGGPRPAPTRGADARRPRAAVPEPADDPVDRFPVGSA
ncbi:hypothetical protein Acsp03_64810 [Actinomadura sp. NBRC 104412]|nr:hypothetical protein Acsp03_64810 [Actinomadura sp. NBRC 104412]